MSCNLNLLCCFRAAVCLLQLIMILIYINLLKATLDKFVNLKTLGF